MCRARMARTLALVVGVNLLLGGCTDWRVQPVEPAGFIVQADPGQVRLDLRDGSRLVLLHPTVLGSEIAGVRGSDSVRIAAADVLRIAVKRTDWVETATLVAGPPALLFGLACAMGCGY
jgi:hypothetical protein